VDPAPWIENLISISTRGFWETGWLYARVQDRLTLSCNGLFALFSLLHFVHYRFYFHIPNQKLLMFVVPFLGRQAYVSVSLATCNR
jgi:hypothetical protein